MKYITFILFTSVLFACKSQISKEVVLLEPGAAEATCSGSGTCKACKNCKYCKNCSQNGGSCSVCK